jgi:hypothetical protein
MIRDELQRIPSGIGVRVPGVRFGFGELSSMSEYGLWEKRRCKSFMFSVHCLLQTFDFNCTDCVASCNFFLIGSPPHK